VTNKYWNRLSLAQFSTWARFYFDNGQAILVRSGSAISLFLWPGNQKPLIDLTRLVAAGLKGFKKNGSRL